MCENIGFACVHQDHVTNSRRTRESGSGAGDVKRCANIEQQ